MSKKKKMVRKHRALVDAFSTAPENLLLVEDETHPLYDVRVHAQVNRSLVQNILFHGVIEPIVARKNGSLLEVVDGRQRVKAAREANKQLLGLGKRPILVPVLLRHEAYADAYGILVSANEMRTDDDVVTKAEKLGKLLSLGWPEDEVIDLFNVTSVTISNWKAVLALAPEVRQAIRAKRITMTDAIKDIGRLPHEAQAAALADVVIRAEPAAEVAVARGARPHKIRTGVGRPVLRRILDTVLAEPHATLSEREIALLGWIDGRMTEDALVRAYPLMSSVIAMASARKRARAKVAAQATGTEARP